MNKPNKVVLRKAGTTTSNIKRESDGSVDERQMRIEKILNAQTFVNTWNKEYVGIKGMDEKDIKSHFDNIKLESGMIIHMYMENPIKHIVRTEDGKVINLDFSLQQIDNRTRNTDKPNWVATPFPVIDKGMIVSISDSCKLWYYQRRKELSQFDQKLADEFIIPEVGDVVYTNLFMFKETRYYVDKQAKCEDFVKSQEEVRLNNFDFLFKISNYEIESIVKRDRINDMADCRASKETILSKDYIMENMGRDVEEHDEKIVN